MSRILLVEDDTMIASGILYALETEGYETNHATGIKDAGSLIEHYNFDLAIIDMQLPDGTGFDVSEIFKNNATSVIFLTVVDDENTIVRAFDEGAQDYIVKPFRIRELLARVRRILSANIKNGEKDNIIYMGHAAIHTDEAKVYVNDKSIELTALEYRLLLIFASNKGLLLTRQQILDKIWDADGNFVEDNTLTVYVKRLREKLGEAIHIETVRGDGISCGLRKKEIEQLSEFVKGYSSGEELDIRVNREGSFNILKNDIYALVNTKNEQIKAVEAERDSLSDYMADISHQLKTPITSMMIMADLLEEQSRKNRQSSFITYRFR